MAKTINSPARLNNQQKEFTRIFFKRKLFTKKSFKEFLRLFCRRFGWGIGRNTVHRLLSERHHCSISDGNGNGNGNGKIAKRTEKGSSNKPVHLRLKNRVKSF